MKAQHHRGPTTTTPTTGDGWQQHGPDRRNKRAWRIWTRSIQLLPSYIAEAATEVEAGSRSNYVDVVFSSRLIYLHWTGVREGRGRGSGGLAAGVINRIKWIILCIWSAPLWCRLLPCDRKPKPLAEYNNNGLPAWSQHTQSKFKSFISGRFLPWDLRWNRGVALCCQLFGSWWWTTPIESHSDSVGGDSALAKFVAALSLPRATCNIFKRQREIGRLVATWVGAP